MRPAFVETSPGTIIMNGTGTDIWNNADQFRFAYKSLKGNGSIMARVDSLANTNAWAKAGVMIRESLDPGSTHATIASSSATSGVSFQHRLVTGDVSTSTDVRRPDGPLLGEADPHGQHLHGPALRGWQSRGWTSRSPPPLYDHHGQ